MKIKEPTSPKISKKQAREMVYDKLTGVFAEYKDGIKEKKFKARLKKASKLLAADVAKAANKANKAAQKEEQLSKKKLQVTASEALGDKKAI